MRCYSSTAIRALGQHTIDIYNAGAMSDQTVGGTQDIVDADAETDFLDHLVNLFRYIFLRLVWGCL